MRSVFVFVAMIGTTSAVFGQQIGPPRDRAETGAEWLARCGPSIKSGDTKGLEAMMNGVSCLGWVNGFIDLNTTYQELSADRQKTFCTPLGTLHLGDAGRVIVSYVEKQQDQSKPIRVMAHAALIGAFPCPLR